jgi:hypothetical protein
MVAVLLPKHLLRQVVEDWMPQKRDGSFRPPTYLLDEEIAEIFEVSREMGRIAGDKMRQLIVDERNQIEMLFGNMQ